MKISSGKIKNFLKGKIVMRKLLITLTLIAGVNLNAFADNGGAAPGPPVPEQFAAGLGNYFRTQYLRH